MSVLPILSTNPSFPCVTVSPYLQYQAIQLNPIDPGSLSMRHEADEMGPLLPRPHPPYMHLSVAREHETGRGRLDWERDRGSWELDWDEVIRVVSLFDITALMAPMKGLGSSVTCEMQCGAESWPSRNHTSGKLEIGIVVPAYLCLLACLLACLVTNLLLTGAWALSSCRWGLGWSWR